MITSRQNPLIKEIKSLYDKKNRDELNLFLVEGVKSVKECIKSGFSVKTLVFTEKGKTVFGETDLPYETVLDSVFNAITDEKTPQGVLAECYKPNTVKLYGGNCIFLDEVKDPSNVGAIIRTAAASGYKNVFLADCADAFSPKSVRASMGGIFKINIVTGKREELLKKIDCPLVVADMHGENVFNTKINEKFCLVVGNEGHGVDKTLKEMAKYTVKIPMQNDMESLNVAVSMGIIAYALNGKIKGE